MSGYDNPRIWEEAFSPAGGKLVGYFSLGHRSFDGVSLEGICAIAGTMSRVTVENATIRSTTWAECLYADCAFKGCTFQDCVLSGWIEGACRFEKCLFERTTIDLRPGERGGSLAFDGCTVTSFDDFFDGTLASSVIDKLTVRPSTGARSKSGNTGSVQYVRHCFSRLARALEEGDPALADESEGFMRDLRAALDKHDPDLLGWPT